MASDENLRGLMRMWTDPATKSRFDALVDNMGMKQVAAATRLFEWFMAQDEEIQRTILQVTPSRYRSVIAEDYLKRVAAGDESRPPLTGFSTPPEPIVVPSPDQLRKASEPDEEPASPHRPKFGPNVARSAASSSRVSKTQRKE